MQSTETLPATQAVLMRTDEWELRYVPLDQIRLDGATQPRVQLNDEVRREYRDLYKAGKELGALVLFHDDEGNYWLADGFHRRWGAVDAGLTEVVCTIYQGSLEDARWFSYAANQTHGLRRTNEDKRKAVKSALLHPAGSSLSDSQLAEHVGVSHPFVAKVRKSLEEAGQLETVTSRTGADGRTRNVGNIGRNSARGAQKRLEVIADRMEADRLPVVVEPEQDVPVEPNAPVACPSCGCTDRREDDLGTCCASCLDPVDDTPTKQADAAKRAPKGVILANEALNVLMRIPKNDQLRARAWQIVRDWLDSNEKGAADEA